MTARSANVANQPVKMPVLVATIAILVVILGGLAWRFFGPTSPAAKPADNPNQTYLKQMAQQSQGDFRRLSPADQQKLYSLFGAQGAISGLQRAYVPPKSSGNSP